MSGRTVELGLLMRQSESLVTAINCQRAMVRVLEDIGDTELLPEARRLLLDLDAHLGNVRTALLSLHIPAWR